jgi:uncharacterized protein
MKKDGVKLEDLYYQVAEKIESAQNYMFLTIKALLYSKKEEMEEYTAKTIATEKESDVIHDTIIQRMFSREVLVFSRPDRLYLINSMDDTVDKAESVVRSASIYFPKSINEKLGGYLNSISVRARNIGSLLKSAVISVFNDFNEALILVKQIEDIRRDARQDFMDYLKLLFELDLETRDLLYLDKLARKILININTANKFADGIRRLVFKYKI